MLGIIGTAGRNNEPLKGEHLQYVWNIVLEHLKGDVDSHICSGGSAWIDHVAVILFNHKQVKELTLYLPAPFNLTEKRYVSTTEGKRLNQLHQSFSQAIGRNTLDEIAQAIECGANTEVFSGFHARNTAIAKSDLVLAFTFGEVEPPPGGTYDTWSKSVNKIHYSLKDC